MVFGETVIEEPTVAPQTYVDPPLAVKVVLSPLQITVSPLMLGVGLLLTTTVVCAVEEHPFPLVTVTVYVPLLAVVVLVILGF